MNDADRIPVIIGVGEICDRPEIDVNGLDSIGLMIAALKAAQQEIGADIIGKLDWLGVEDQISFPIAAPQEQLAEQLQIQPAHLVKTFEASGDGPIFLINEAANMIGKGEVRLAAAVGGEALRTAAKRTAAAVAAGGEPPENAMSKIAIPNTTPMARQYGLFTPIDVYPLYENATRAAWGQSFAEAQEETAEIWAGFSKVAAANPQAWIRQPASPQEITDVTADNRIVSFPYTKFMVANAGVNMGAAVIVASLAMARELGVPDDRIVFVGRGAAAHESTDFLKRDSYARSASLETTVAAALDRNGLTAQDIDFVELYSCFPCVPKMARRVLGWPVDRPATLYGGLTFGGGPIGNCMMHAAARMVHKLRAEGTHGLIVANGGYATHSHSLVLTRQPQPAGLFPQDYSAQAEADARRGTVPTLLDSYEGEGTIETFTIPFGRKGAPAYGTIIARTPAGERFVAHVPADDKAMLDFLMDSDAEPVGTKGFAVRTGEKICWSR